MFMKYQINLVFFNKVSDVNESNFLTLEFRFVKTWNNPDGVFHLWQREKVEKGSNNFSTCGW